MPVSYTHLLALKSVADLAVLYYKNAPAGFIGIEDKKVEMLFILPDYLSARHTSGIKSWISDSVRK